MPKLLIAAGGTGGHMFPAQALAEVLGANGWSVAMMTDSRGRKHVGHIPADPVIEVQAATISPRKPIQAVGGVMRLSRGVRQAKHFIKRWGPDIVVGFGGYPAFPAMCAAQILGVPRIIHEQNAVLGRVNRLFAARTTWVATGFDNIKRLPEGAHHVCTGNPLRQQIIDAVPVSYTPPSQVNSDPVHLLIIGGSLGARIMSEVMPKAIATLPDVLRQRLSIVQQTRPENLDEARDIYKAAGVNHICEPFFSNIEQHLAQAHYVIGRAGASSVSEIAVMGKPALFVPLAIAMDDHQTCNALTLKNLDAADILPETEFTPETVKFTLERRLNDSIWLERAARAAKAASRPDAAQRLADLVVSTLS